MPWDRGPADMLVGVIGVSYLEEMNYNIHVRQFIKDILFITKDRLYYRLCQEMKDNEANFPSTMFDSEIRKVVEVVTNALWYLDGCKDTINSRSRSSADVQLIPYR